MRQITIVAIILAALAAIFNIWSLDTMIVSLFILGLLVAFVVVVCGVANRGKK